MADSVMDDELISQDDIDNLINASGEIDEADALNADELGELSQDDIDSLLSSNTESGEDDEEFFEDADDDMELISQDDIDSLINADDEALAQAEQEDDELGELSQDDIGSLMNKADDGAPADSGLAQEDELGELSQDDIDNLLNSGADQGPAQDLEVTDDFGELSQDDIDSLMNNTDDGTPIDSELAQEDELGELSQDDIDSLLNSDADNDTDETGQQEDDEVGELSQDDIDSLMGASSKADAVDWEDVEERSRDEAKAMDQPDGKSSSTAETSETKVPREDESIRLDSEIQEDIGPSRADEGSSESAGASDHDEWLISESEAVAAQECTVTQETIDGLIENFDPTPDSEPVVLDEDEMPVDSEPEPVQNEDPSVEADFDPEFETRAQDNASIEKGTDESSGENFLEDTGDLENDSDVTVFDLEEDEDEDVSQEDIDELLMDGEEDDEDILISQDDIDTLLMAADDDDDALGEFMDDEDETSDMDEAFDDEDFLENDTDDAFDEIDEDDDDENQVVLEEDDVPVKKKKKKTVKKSKAKWYKSRPVIACAAALVVLGITVPLTYFFFWGQKNQDSNGQQIAMSQSSISQTGTQMTDQTQLPVMHTVDVVVQQPVASESGNMVLKDFVVLAPVQAKEVSYVTLDISIDYSDQRAYHEIQENLAFYRDLIYDSVKKKLGVTRNQVEVTESDILLAIEDTLKKVMPGNYIDRVSLKSFKIT